MFPQDVHESEIVGIAAHAPSKPRFQMRGLDLKETILESNQVDLYFLNENSQLACVEVTASHHEQ